MSERDFKGVWIPKELWLNKELTLLEKCIFIEIDSLDNEDHCIASNEYFAEFCNCSESKVSKVIRRLQDLNMIEISSFDGRHRKIRVIKNARQPGLLGEAASENIRPININNNIINKKDIISKDIISVQKPEFEFGKPKEKKLSLYHKCVAHVNDFTREDPDSRVRNLLLDFLNSLVDMGKLRGEKQFVGILNKLKEYGDTEDKKILIIKTSIEHGWASFYEYKEAPKGYNKPKAASDIGKHAKRLTDEQKRQAQEDIKNGRAEKF